MEMQKIDTTTAAPMLCDLFSVQDGFRGTNGKGGTAGKGKTLPARAAERAEVKAYAEFLRRRAGLPEIGRAEPIMRGQGRGRNNHVYCVGVTYGLGGDHGGYHSGAYSVLFPGANRMQASVTMETLDDAGEIVATSTMPVEPKKGGVVWTLKDVRAAHGPKGTPIPGEPIPTGETEPEPVAEPAPPTEEIPQEAAQEPQERETVADPTPEQVEADNAASGPENEPQADEAPADDPLADILARLEAIEAQLAAVDTLPAESVEGATEAIQRPKRTAAHERAIRQAWAQRKARRNAEMHLRIGRDQYDRLQAQYENAAKARTDFLRGMNEACERERAERAKRRASAERARRMIEDLRISVRNHDGISIAVSQERAKAEARAERAEAELARLKRDMADPSQPERASDIARLVQERDTARNAVAALEQRCERQEAALQRGAEAIEQYGFRLAQAEAKLRKIAA